MRKMVLLCDAIVAALRESAEEWAASVVDETAGANCRLAEDGTAHIGLWRITACVEECDGQPLRFLYRAAGAQVPSYAAEVVRSDPAPSAGDRICREGSSRPQAG